MKALIIGKGGQVATELVRRIPEGCRTVVLGRTEMDLSDPGSCAEAVGATDADVVINAVAYTAVDKAESDEVAAMFVNADAPAAMARAAAEKGLPFLHVSTDYVYDGSGDAPFLPDSPTGPLGAYGRTKLAGDQAIGAAGGKFAVLRTSWVFSAHGANFVKTMLRLGREREQLNVVSDQIGGPTPAAAIADALWQMAHSFLSYRPSGYLRTDGSALSGIYHFSGVPDVSWADFAREIFQQASVGCEVREIPTTEYPTPAKRPLNSRLDCMGLHETFGIKRPDWRAGLADVLRELSNVEA